MSMLVETLAPPPPSLLPPPYQPSLVGILPKRFTPSRRASDRRCRGRNSSLKRRLVVKQSPSTAVSALSHPYPQTHPGDLSRPAGTSRRHQASLVGDSRAKTSPSSVAPSICSHLHVQTSAHTTMKLAVRLPI
ncbi:hypothetical protein V6N13_038502 [Hibiscus sabdariffa]|uniref:Uncharacterized protein n=1 Tax=Hibiscus sabdariffa TaxID=183260 RepID=A0ABR2S1T1_9ROSI